MKTIFALSLVIALCGVSVHGQDGFLPNYQLSGTFLLEPSQTVAFPMYALPQNSSELIQQPLAIDPSVFQQPAFFIPQAPSMGYPPQGFVPINQFPVAPPQTWPGIPNPRAIVPSPNVNYPYQLAQAGVPGSSGQPQVYLWQPTAAPEGNKIYPTAAPKAAPLLPCQLLMQRMMAQSQPALPSGQ
ncbi:uncharacterized protein LOC108733447 [Agrilus planipennis]|uniref:Uncharacterized protein LOC108733447 n=1 Tax=Agrilus planipennis TaxID=224129 RepID=A0A1W4W7Q9_AGRPL|nr:uncharacterized protein LOC108733447 [Agrilus planipennis]